VRSRVLVVGGAGYVGSVLTRLLLADGHEVRVLDALLYGRSSVDGLVDHPNFDLIVGDTRDEYAVGEALADVDSVVHLGELVGDPACALDPATTIAINHEATRRIAEQAADYGVRRFVYPSSCSVYGANDEVVDEGSLLNPVSLYAETKVLAEEAVAGVATRMETVILRLATVYGISPRPRFDLVVNQFAARGLVEGEIVVHGGQQWRPFVHVADVADVIRTCLDAPAALVAGRTFNVGSDDQNRTVGQIADLVERRAPGIDVRVEPIDDHRNYRVSFARVRDELGFIPKRDLEHGIAEIHHAVSTGTVEDYRDESYSNVEAMRRSLSPMSSSRSSVMSGGRRKGAEPELVGGGTGAG
jgi:nucleoside-diphosphate-sugar epimerase